MLDIACGTGRVARCALSRIPNLHITGVDLNKDMLAVAQSLGPTVRWLQARADQIPLEDTSFDVVTCQQGMQFFPSPAAAATEMTRLAASGGRIAATVWAQIDSNPYFQAQAEALDQYIDGAAAQGVNAAVPTKGDALLSEAFELADLCETDIRRVDRSVQINDISSFAREQIASTPWSSSFQKATIEKQRAFEEHIATSLARYTDAAANSLIPFSSWLLTTRKR